MSATEIAERECPNCHEPVPVDGGYPIWCDRCDWNMRPPQMAVSDAPFASLYARMGEKSGWRLFEQLTRTDTLRSTMTLVKLLGFAGAAVHGATFLIAFGGIALLVSGHGKSAFTVGGVLCLLIAWFVRPRVTRLKGKNWPGERKHHRPLR